MIIDARGKACPQPVVLSLHALAQLKGGEPLEVWVDNEAAVENLKRMGGCRSGTEPRVTDKTLPRAAAAALSWGRTP